VDDCVEKYDYCVVVVSEGAAYPDGRFLADAGTTDAFGHKQLGGVASVVADMVRSELGHKFHYAIADYLQRSARHIASATDVKQAYAVGEAAVKLALAGKTAVMPVIKRVSDKPYRWKIETAPLSRIANKEKMLPKSYIRKDGFGITEAARTYLEPLIRGEDYPPYIKGLPKYVTLKGAPVRKRLKEKFVV
jgi:6-phosphofructokinase 1